MGLLPSINDFAHMPRKIPLTSPNPRKEVPSETVGKWSGVSSRGMWVRSLKINSIFVMFTKLRLGLQYSIQSYDGAVGVPPEFSDVTHLEGSQYWADSLGVIQQVIRFWNFLMARCIFNIFGMI